MKKFFMSLFFYVLSGSGISLTIKADIGVSSFNSLNVAIAAVTRSQIGTITFLVNGLFLFVYILLSKPKSYLKYLLIFISILCLGSIINVITYDILGTFSLENYVLRLLLFIFGTCLAGFATGMIIAIGVLSFPIESVCLRLSELTGRSFRFFRYGVDGFSLFISLVLSFSYQQPIFVREGTLISFLLLSGVISMTKSGYQAILNAESIKKEA
ncbi:hypothetical protein GIX45_26220 [Erwinia sp. CPCC 100877]|nr:hypothetical protein [Erwinia sp. CPCC 100877]